MNLFNLFPPTSLGAIISFFVFPLFQIGGHYHLSLLLAGGPFPLVYEAVTQLLFLSLDVSIAVEKNTGQQSLSF